MRIGQGFDVHQLMTGRRLILGGVPVPYEKGLLGHSDADVLVHAIIDALLGAIGAGDIGSHFPDNDPGFKDADSMKMLNQVLELVKAAGFEPVNLDATLIAQRPRLAGFIPQMRKNLSQSFDLPVEQVNVKATTTEKLGFTGRGEGIAAAAVVLLQRVGENRHLDAGCWLL